MLRLFKKLVFIGFSVLFIFIFALTVNGVRKPSQQLEIAPVDVTVKQSIYSELLSKAIQIPTISQNLSNTDTLNAFGSFRQFLQDSFPLILQKLTLETVNNQSLLLTWNGQDAQLKPVMFVAHYDVVDVDQQTLSDWTHPPFSGLIADGFVWGRGAMDDKAAIIAILSAVEKLLSQEFQPRRTVLLAFGHDEEIGGNEGAASIATRLATRGIRPEFILDEGMPITDGIIAGSKNPIAMIGIAEKGGFNLELVVDTPGGHSSSPPAHTAVGILAQAITRIEQNPMPVHMDGVIGKTFDAISPDMQLVQRVVLGNRWLLESLIAKQLSGKPSTNASIRTTMAPTMITGSTQPNVLPTRATAIINVRLLPGDTVLKTLEYIQNVINDNRVQINIQGDPVEPSTISDTNDNSYKLIERTLRELFPNTLVAPAQMIAGTDSKHYASLTKNIYRFRPVRLTQEDIKRFHGINERISIENLDNSVRFYLRFIENIDQPRQ